MLNTKLLKQLRKEKGLTQEELAEKVGVGQSAISKFEKGFDKPSIETLCRIGKVLGIDYKALLK